MRWYKEYKTGGEGMVLQGQLNLSYDKCEYIMFHSGRNDNISDILYSMFMDKVDVAVEIVDIYSGEVLFDAEGELYKERVQPKFYTYHIGDKDNLDKVLWDNVGRKVSINIKNITKE